jgi:DNA adenine methylase
MTPKPLLKPALKWAGGKRWLLPHLVPLWARHESRRLVEPFCGGLAVPLGLQPKRGFLTDINPHLINFYQWLQRGLVVEIELENDEELYYVYRERFNELIRNGQQTSQEAASLFYYLNRTGYNGLCRFNRKGEFNVPVGRYKTINYVRDFRHYQPMLSRWVFSVCAFDAVPAAPDDFIYADPPYDVEFTQYSKEKFGWDEQVKLAEWLADHPGPVVLSNQATDRIVRLYLDLGFQVRQLDGPRRISRTGDRTPAKEVLATRNV